MTILNNINAIYFNGHSCKQAWLDGVLIFPPQTTGSSQITFYNASNEVRTIYFQVINDSLPYNVNGQEVMSYIMQPQEEVTLTFENLKFSGSYICPKYIEKYDLSQCEDLSYAFLRAMYGKDYTINVDGIKLHPQPTSTRDMFCNCTYLEDEDMKQLLSQIKDTSKVTDMKRMFYGCSFSLTSLDLRNFNTSNVINMQQMFDSCNELITLDLYNFNTSNVTNMGFMFDECFKLTSLNLSSFDTSNVTNMRNMFFNCASLTYLDLTNFNTSNVTDMSFMFNGCAFKKLDLSSFDTSKVVNMTNMFAYCRSLKEIDLTSFDTSKVQYATDMFKDVSDCTIYISDDWTLSTDSNAYGGTNLNFVRPIRQIDLATTTTVFKPKTIFTINPTIVPTNYVGDELVITYNENKLSRNGNTFTVLDTADVAEELTITYSSKLRPKVKDTLSFVIANKVPYDSITLTSNLQGIVDVGTKFTITCVTTPTVNDDELVITYDETKLTRSGNTFTITSNASLGETLSITYSSKLDSNVSDTYNVTLRDVVPYDSITLAHSLSSLIIEPNTTFTITPTVTPTTKDDELMVEFDDTYITKNGNTFTVANAPYNEQLSIKYYSKLNPTVSATLNLTVRDVAYIDSITLTHTLSSLVDVPTGTTFKVTSTVNPTVHDDELLIDYDTNYLSYDATTDTYTVLDGAKGQTVQLIYYSKHDNNVNAMIEFNVVESTMPYTDCDSYIILNKTSSSNIRFDFPKIDSTSSCSFAVSYNKGKRWTTFNTNTFRTSNTGEIHIKLISNLGLGNGLSATTYFTNTINNISEIHQLDLSKQDNLAGLFYSLGISTRKNTLVLKTENFKFHPQPIAFANSSGLGAFSNCKLLTQEQMQDIVYKLPTDMSQVTTMFSMFASNNQITSLDLSRFDFGDNPKLTDISGMFQGCSSLTSLDLRNFNTSNVTSMNQLFYQCTSLKEIHLESFDTSKASNPTNMFYGVSDCTIYISDKWTLNTTATAYRGKNLTFVRV